MKIVPITLRQASEFVDEHHRHNHAPQGHKFSIGLENNGELVGVAICGRPVSRVYDDGKTAEITRVCVLENNRNANSMLYGACCRACKAMGYESVITYTLVTESGSSLKASGFVSEGIIQMHKEGWSSKQRDRGDQPIYHVEKIRWRKKL